MGSRGPSRIRKRIRDDLWRRYVRVDESRTDDDGQVVVAVAPTARGPLPRNFAAHCWNIERPGAPFFRRTAPTTYSERTRCPLPFPLVSLRRHSAQGLGVCAGTVQVSRARRRRRVYSRARCRTFRARAHEMSERCARRRASVTRGEVGGEREWGGGGGVVRVRQRCSSRWSYDNATAVSFTRSVEHELAFTVAPWSDCPPPLPPRVSSW